MSFAKTFCSSPWFHMRINNSGHYEYCRWANKTDRHYGPAINEVNAIQWFQHGMKDLRLHMLSGKIIPGCNDCHIMEQHGKISGRQRQLLKIGVTVENFDKSLTSSPWFREFERTSANHGITDQWPQDWQIDLGNYCNSACLFCSPHSSSRLASEFKQLKLIETMPVANWCEDPNRLAKFVDVLAQSPRLCYLHFLGGETLITPAFKIILEALISKGLSSDVSIGFTTNLTVWDQSVVDLLCEFKEVNLGMSIECLHPLNDYVRYGGDLANTISLLERWTDLATQQNWISQLRVTPTVFTIWHLETVYEYAYQRKLPVESCNFLDKPEHMRPSVLPADYRALVIQKLQEWIDRHVINQTQQLIINTRNLGAAHHQILQDAQSYVTYLRTQSDESHRLPDLVRYIKTMEQKRKNSILNYLPEYESILRSAGY